MRAFLHSFFRTKRNCILTFNSLVNTGLLVTKDIQKRDHITFYEGVVCYKLSIENQYYFLQVKNNVFLDETPTNKFNFGFIVIMDRMDSLANTFLFENNTSFYICAGKCMVTYSIKNKSIQ
jgi:hypothetical protein